MNWRMNTLLVLAITLVFAAAPGAGFADDGPKPGEEHATPHKTDFAKAKALGPSRLQASPADRVPETDGLSRNAEDCDFGCIDNGH